MSKAVAVGLSVVAREAGEVEGGFIVGTDRVLWVEVDPCTCLG